MQLRQAIAADSAVFESFDLGSLDSAWLREVAQIVNGLLEWPTIRIVRICDPAHALAVVDDHIAPLDNLVMPTRSRRTKIRLTINPVPGNGDSRPAVLFRRKVVSSGVQSEDPHKGRLGEEPELAHRKTSQAFQPPRRLAVGHHTPDRIPSGSRRSITSVSRSASGHRPEMSQIAPQNWSNRYPISRLQSQTIGLK